MVCFTVSCASIYEVQHDYDQQVDFANLKTMTGCRYPKNQHKWPCLFYYCELFFLLFIAGKSSLKSLHISHHLLNKFIVQILA